jgi:DNA-binding CsgD family transcriptional regulator
VASDEHIEAARAALAESRWEEARAGFEASLAEGETPEALEGLGTALWWLCEARESARHRERAFVLFRQAGDYLRACAIAVDLVVTYLFNLGNAPAAHGWLGRGERVGQEIEPNPMQGWLWLMRGYLKPDPDASRAFLGRALEHARELEDRDLELVALGDLGLNRVAKGDVDEGMAMLDEAMAGSMGGDCGRLETVVYNCCSMLSACHRAGDSERAAQWCRVADEFQHRYTCPFLFARCRVHYGSLLLTKGQWARAEAELRAALHMAKDAGPAPRVEALVGLAQLRLRQGRVEEATELLAGCDETGAAAQAAAELRLAQDEPTAAVAILERRLARVSKKPVEAVPALALLVNAHVACGDLASAEEAAARLDALVRTQGGEEAAALAAFASARVLAARGRLDEATGWLEEALEGLSSVDLPFETAQIRLELASALAHTRPLIAASEARSALRAFERIGATAYADHAAALLRSLGQRVRLGTRNAGVLTSREQEVLRLVSLGLSNPEIAKRLFISRKTAAHHVSNILMKLGLTNRGELVAYATRTQIEAGPDGTRVGSG